MTLIPGDGIGPEISDAVKDVFASAMVCAILSIHFLLFHHNIIIYYLTS